MPLEDNSIVLVTGASGIVGSGIVNQFLQSNRVSTVIAPVRTEDAKSILLLDVPANYIDRLDAPVLGDYTASADNMRRLLVNYIESKYGKESLHHVVSCFGGNFKQGPISSLSADDVHQALDRAIPHLLLVQAVMPQSESQGVSSSSLGLLKPSPSSSITFVTGMLGERCSMPGVSALCVANASIYGIIRAVEGEFSQRNILPRVNEVRIAALIRRDREPGHPFIKEGKAFPASRIGDYVVRIAEDEGKRNEIFRIFSSDLEEDK